MYSKPIYLPNNPIGDFIKSKYLGPTGFAVSKYRNPLELSCATGFTSKRGAKIKCNNNKVFKIVNPCLKGVLYFSYFF